MSYFPRRIGQPSVEPFTLADVLAHLHENAGVADAKIEGLIRTARETCENLTERTLIATPWRLTLDRFPCAVILRRPPIIEVTSVVYFDPDGIQQTLDPQDYLLDAVSEPGYLVPNVGRSWPATQDRINAVQINYRAGYGTEPVDIPGPLRDWMLLAIADMYTNRRAHGEKPSVKHGFVDHLLNPFEVVGV